MKELIDVYRMNEISIDARIKIIKKLGEAINHQMCSNITAPLVYELVLLLDPDDPIKDNEYFIECANR